MRRITFILFILVFLSCVNNLPAAGHWATHKKDAIASQAVEADTSVSPESIYFRDSDPVLLVLVAQVQADDELNVFEMQGLHQRFVTELAIQHQGTVAEQLLDFIEAAKVFLVARSALLPDRSR